MAKKALSPKLFSKMVDLITEEIHADGFLAFFLGKNNEILFQKSRDADCRENSGFRSKVIRRAMETGEPLFIGGTEEAGFRNGRNAGFPPGKSILCLPLIVGDRTAGVIYLDREKSREPFSRGTLELLVELSRPICFILQDDGIDLKSKKQLAGTQPPDGFFIGQSRIFRRILALIDKVKDTDAPVFICGESGTGKELIARAIHQKGRRKKGQFVAVNCGAIPEHLLESELFGYVKGAFTGALRNKTGLMEEAQGGTFFLDEIGDLSPHLQAKLLRVIQEKEIRRIGENRIRKVDVRFISATNKDIEKEVGKGNFREDLYYRLRIITIEIPPLRERKEDLFLLVDHFLEKYCAEMRRTRVHFSPRALEFILGYPWPGNVRELQNEIQRCLIISGEDGCIREEHLSSGINPGKETSSPSPYNFFEAKADFERRFLNQALRHFDYKKTRTAEKIGLTRQGLFKLMKKHKIDVSTLREKTRGTLSSWK